MGPDGAKYFGARKRHILRGTKFSLPKPRVSAYSLYLMSGWLVEGPLLGHMPGVVKLTAVHVSCIWHMLYMRQAVHGCMLQPTVSCCHTLIIVLPAALPVVLPALPCRVAATATTPCCARTTCASITATADSTQVRIQVCTACVTLPLLYRRAAAQQRPRAARGQRADPSLPLP